MSSTHSLETMPRFALSTDDEGRSRMMLILDISIHGIYQSLTFLTVCCLQLRWSCQTFGGSGFAATAQGPNTPPPKIQPALGASVTSWRRQTDRGFLAEGRFPSQPPSQPCLSSLLQVQKVIIRHLEVRQKTELTWQWATGVKCCMSSTFTPTICCVIQKLDADPEPGVTILLVGRIPNTWTNEI